MVLYATGGNIVFFRHEIYSIKGEIVRQQGHLLVADITGYAEFRDPEELAHAENILKDLFRALTRQLNPPWEIRELGADPIFAYFNDGDILQGQTLLEMVEAVYRSFAKKREQILQNTTCSCKACEQISVLSLKIVVHHGSFIMSEVAGGGLRFTGEDLVIVHKLLRNRITEVVGIGAYAFFTETAANAMSLGELVHGMKIHTESYEQLGQYGGFVHDLHAIWERAENSRRIYVDTDKLYFKVERNIPTSLAFVWDRFTELDRWKRRLQADYLAIEGKSQGRVGIACDLRSVHGKKVNAQTILDWKPFDYFTTDIAIPFKGVMRQTTQLSVTEVDGEIFTRVSLYFGKPVGKNLIHTLLVKLRMVFAKGKIKRGEKRGLEIIYKVLEAELGRIQPK